MLGTTKFVPGSSTDRPREACHAFDELWLLVPLVLRLVTGRVRGFAGDGHPLLIAIRHRPCAALLRALARRLSPRRAAQDGAYTLARARVSKRVRRALVRHGGGQVAIWPRGHLLPRLALAGHGAAVNTHWLCPVFLGDPAARGRVAARLH